MSFHVAAHIPESLAWVLSVEARAFLAALAANFESRRRELLAARSARSQRLRDGELPDFLPQTKAIRESNWRVAAIPPALQDRRVEITGPTERKMVINALNSGAKLFMADLEDSNSPTWDNCLQGQANLFDAIRREISYDAPNGKQYRLNPEVAVLLVRPRGWHMEEKHIQVDGANISASLFDFGLYFFHNASELLARGFGPYFYLPKMESHLEARLWNEVFVFAQDYCGVPQGSIRATVLIETILAAFEMDEILYELRDHSAGLNCGRWDYIFSYLKKLGHRADKLLPDRGQVTMDKAFLKAYVELLISTCHKRGIHAMGGMAAQIPIKNDAAANDAAMEKVRRDKEREVLAGHDGTWVAHPGLVGLAMEIFNQHMPAANQIAKLTSPHVSAEDLLRPHTGSITEAGLKQNIDVALSYLEAWLAGNGCVAIHNLMEDAATAEISRTQVWQWIRHAAKLDTGATVDFALVDKLVAEDVARRAPSGTIGTAAQLFRDSCSSEVLPDFLTLQGYGLLP
jgi:malate synthase